jgi:Ca-activated chloride channel family protein
MTCDQAELRMAELLLGELPAGERGRLERHLLDCACCRADYELARAGARIEWADVPVPPALIESTLASLRETPRAARFFRWATAAAALVGVAILLVNSGRGTRPTSTIARGPDQLSCVSEPLAAPPTQTAACSVDRPTILATVQEPLVGALEAKDEDGRPVGDLGMTSHNVSVEILDGIAKTTVAEIFENRTDRRLEGTFSFPLPSDASISRLALEVNGKMEEGSCLERERARQVFESIVRRMQDPALLEWQPGGLFKCRIFPIEPRATKRVLVAYTQTLPCFQGKMRYVYPLASEKTRNHPPGEVRINVLARFSGGLSAMESTSHHLDVQRKDAREASMAFRATNYRPRNDFVVTLEPAEEELRVVCHKPEGEDGYFACFATPQATEPRAPRKYTFVLDASASTSAPRLEVAKRLVRAMMERRIEGDRFEVIAHSIETRSSGEVDLRAANTFMDAIRPIGGSDVLKALRAAGPGEIVYIGRGLPTFGEMDAAKILEAVKGLRIRTIAVGSDANEPLLERLGGLMRITPNDEVDKRVAEIAATLGSAAVAELTVEGANVRDVVGARDVFAGERVVLAGRYTAAGPSKLVVHGRGYRREIDVTFPEHEEGNNPIRRLWAQRKVADLLAQGESSKPKVTELGVKYQIMTPYTSFLVLENEQMWKDHQLQREKQKQDEVLGKAMEEEKKRGAEALQNAKGGVTAQASSEEMEKLARELAQGRSAADQQAIYESQRHYEQALMFNNRGDFERAKAESQKAVEAWHENVAARKLLNDVNRITVDRPEGARSIAEDSRDDFRIRIEQAQIEITKHVRDGERYLNARMYEQAVKEFENAEFKIQNIPYEVRAMNELLPLVKDSIVKSRNARILEGLRTEEEKKRMSEAEAAAHNLKSVPGPSEWEEVLAKVRDVPTEVHAQSEANQHFRLAERYYNAGDFEKAEVESQKALKTAPNHAPARALQAEVQFILGKGKATPSTEEYDGFMKESLVRHQQLLVEMDNALERGRRFRAAGDVESANRESRKVLEFSKWMPTGVELDARRKQALDLIDNPTGQVGPGFSSQQAARIDDLQRELDRANTLVTKNQADMEVFVRQLDVQLAEIQDLTTKVEEGRTKDVPVRRSLVSAELQYAQQLAERTKQDLAQLEEKHVEFARDQKHLEEKINALAQNGGNLNIAPRKALEAKVTAVANGIGLVVMSIGKDDGVLEGDEFTVFRGGDFVAKIVIDRADRKWSAGKVILKKSDPRVGDDVSNHIFVSRPPVPPPPLSEDQRLDLESRSALRSIRAKMEMKE